MALPKAGRPSDARLRQLLHAALGREPERRIEDPRTRVHLVIIPKTRRGRAAAFEALAAPPESSDGDPAKARPATGLRGDRCETPPAMALIAATRLRAARVR